MQVLFVSHKFHSFPDQLNDHSHDNTVAEFFSIIFVLLFFCLFFSSMDTIPEISHCLRNSWLCDIGKQHVRDLIKPRGSKVDRHFWRNLTRKCYNDYICF